MGVFRGTDGKDIFQGTRENDIFYGHGGDDVLAGGRGRNTLFGDAGEDVIILDAAGDTIAFGGDGSGNDGEQDTFFTFMGTRGEIRDFEPGIDKLSSILSFSDNLDGEVEDTDQGVVLRDPLGGEILIVGVTEDELRASGSILTEDELIDFSIVA